MNERAELERLIGRTSLRDRKAFDALYDATSAKLFGVCLRVLKDRTTAQDALQDTYVKIWRNSGRFQPGPSSPMSWLITIARNTAVDQLRAEKVRPKEESEVLESLASSDLGPEETVIARAEAARIAACMAELGEAQREAVRGAYLEGQSYAQLSQKLDIPLNTIRTWLRRGLRSLRECLIR